MQVWIPGRDLFRFWSPLRPSFHVDTPFFSSLLEVAEGYSSPLLPPILQAALPLALTSTPPLQRNSSKLNMPVWLLGLLLSHRKCSRNTQGAHTFYHWWSKLLLHTENGLGLMAELPIYGKGRGRGARRQSCLSDMLSSCLSVRTGTTLGF